MTPVGASSDPMTDDRAPIEWITDRMIVEHIARGHGLDEQLLPCGRVRFFGMSDYGAARDGHQGIHHPCDADSLRAQ